MTKLISEKPKSIKLPHFNRTEKNPRIEKERINIFQNQEYR